MFRALYEELRQPSAAGVPMSRFWQAALVIVVGNLSYLITGLGSLQGPKAGTAAFTMVFTPN